METVWVPRSEWGSLRSTEDYLEDRAKDPAHKKTEIQVHHTARIDGNDNTPNRWDYDEAVAYMRALQWVRPDLQPLPYSENVAVSEDLNTVWVFEGCGILTRGMHTGGHNVAGVGWGIFGNFDKFDIPAARAAVAAVETRARLYRSTITPNLGDTPNPKGWPAWGHRDSSTKSCPGNYLYPLLAAFTLEEDMTPDEFRAIVREELDAALGPKIEFTDLEGKSRTVRKSMLDVMSAAHGGDTLKEHIARSRQSSDEIADHFADL